MIIFRNLLAATAVGVFAFYNAQQITYFDDNWEPTTKDKMVYYREATKQGNLTLIKDYYSNGVLQMKGNAVDPTVNNEVWDGQVTWYYATGKVQNSITYKNGVAVGPSVSYDEKGRITSDVSYTEDYDFSGKMYSYEDADVPDSYNSVTEYKKGTISKEFVYGQSKNGIRYEVDYKDGSYNTTTRYYDANGKLIGTSDYKDGSTTGTVVEYYRLPMQVLSIKKMGKGDEFTDQIVYYRSGKVAQELTRKYKKSGLDKTYDENGKLIGSLTYKFLDDYGYYVPQDGKLINFAYSSTDISQEYDYQNGILIKDRYYNDTSHKLEIENFYNPENSEQTKTVYYDPVMGTKRGELIFKDGSPYSGTSYSEFMKTVYKDGKVQQFINYDADGQVVSEGELSKDGKTFNAKIYGLGKEIIATYVSDALSASFDAKVMQYEKGKVVRTATIKNSNFVDGKLVITQYSGEKIEYERKGDWRYLRTYNEKGVVTEEVKKRYVEEDYSSDTFYITEDFLLNRNYY